jgi:glutathionylspermidine synthase
LKNLQQLLTTPAKTQFFEYLSAESYRNLPADLLTIFEGPPEQRRPYVIFDALPVSRNFCQTLRQAAECFWQVAIHTSQVFQFLPESEILDWGFPPDYIPQILGINLPPTEMRLDVAVNPQAFALGQFSLQDFKVLEANAATPGFWAETFVLNELIVNHLGKACPNHDFGRRQTQDWIDYLRQRTDYRHRRDTLHFSFPFAGEHEDILSFDARMAYFQQLEGKAEFCYTEDFILETDPAQSTRLINSKTQEPVKYLFLHYPNEWLLEDRGEILTDDALSAYAPIRPWDYLQELTLNQQLCRLPPIASDIIQNKAFFAFLWEGVHRQRFDFTTSEMIKDLIPPTYCSIEEAHEYEHFRVWEKPIYGREGAGVILWDGEHEVVNTYDPDFEDNEWYQNMLAIFQADCPMPKYAFADAEIYLMFTVYLSALGKATGIGCRAVPTAKHAIDARYGLWYPLSLS